MAALDVGKATLTCCIRLCLVQMVWRQQEVAEYPTTTAGFVATHRLLALGVTRVVMESTSDYWPAVVLPVGGARSKPWLVNARDVKHLPGRPKTDRLDAVWLAKLAERQMLRPVFVPPFRDPPSCGTSPGFAPP